MSQVNETASSYGLTPDQGDTPVDTPSENGSTQQNVGQMERNISVVAGALIGMAGLTKPLSLRGLLELGLGAALVHRGLTGHCYLYDAIGLNTADTSGAPSAEPSEYFNRSIHVQHTVTINKPAAELFRFWRQFDNLPRFMQHLKDVKVLDDKRSHWTAKGPMNSSIDWDAEIINEETDKLIAWRSTGDAEVDNSGSVRFIENGDRGTEVIVTIDYIPPAGRVGAMVAKWFGEEPDTQVREDLRRFKQLMETGEVPSTEGQATGNCTDCG